MELRELRFALRRYWPGAVVVLAVCLLVGAVAGYLPEKTYRATSTVFAQPRVTAGGPEGSAREAAFVIPGLLETVESGRFRTAARERVPAEFQSAAVSVNADTDVAAPSVIAIAVEGSRADAVAAWANALAAHLLEQEDPRGFVSLTLLDEARVPGSPAAPKPLPIMVGSAFLGVLGGIFLVIIAYRARKAFDAEEDIRQLLGTSLLAEIPVARQLRGRVDRTVLEAIDDPEDELSEAFQALRTELEFRLVDGEINAVSVTSYEAGDGKSTVAAGLAWSLAAVGHRVTLVDADLRAPAIHRVFREKMTEGFADLDEVEFSAAVRPTRMPGLDYLPAGLPHGRPGDVVTVSLPHLFSEVNGEPRLLVIDAPPLGVGAEAPAIAKAAGHVVLVVDRERWALPEVANAVARLRESGAVLIGVVVNRVPRRLWRKKHGYYTSTRRPARKASGRDTTPQDAPAEPGTGRGAESRSR